MEQNISTSKELLSRAAKVIPGSVNSPVRAFTQVGGTPRFIESGKGPNIYDVDGNSYVDFIGSWGPMILGHASEIQLNAISEVIKKGTSFGAPTKGEVEFAEMICGLIPGLDLIRLVSSGTEATMSAVRLARAYTSRSKIIKFNGCYHGHSDALLVQAGSGAATQGISGSLGVSEETAKNTISIEYNNIELLQEVVQKVGSEEIACIIIEPVAGNMGLIIPDQNFIKELRDLCTLNGIVLIFDEVMSGFRVSLGGASKVFNVIPDLFCFGKVIGGGLPMAAFGGRKEIMNLLAPIGGVYQAGTLSGNPVAVAVAKVTLDYLIKNNPYPELSLRTKQLTEGLLKKAQNSNIPLQISSLGSMFGFFFSDKKVKNYEDVKNSNIERFKKFFHLMLEDGVYFAPSAFEAGFLGVTHTEEVIENVLNKADRAFKAL